VDAAVKKLDARAQDKSLGRCAEYVRVAIEAGGVTLVRHTSAKDYGDSLLGVGFSTVSDGLSKAGDVAIIQPIAGHPHGHMAMFDGRIWVSDFKQYRGYYPGPGYRKIKPPVSFYRYGMQAALPPILPRVFDLGHSQNIA
jgi:hypothetical protein